MRYAPHVTSDLDSCQRTVRTNPSVIKNGSSCNILKEDMPMPLMVLKQKNYLHNLKTFSNYLEKHNLHISPHGKTTMAPQIFSEQIKHGAWGITAGAINQIQVMFDFGINKVLLANQLLGKSHLETIASYLSLIHI